TRVETQVAGNNQSLAQARQNALMALNIAIGQLQKHTGPDQRVTATADLQPLATVAAPATYPSADPASGQNLTAAGTSTSTRIAATATALDNIDTYWRASRNRRWTGAWKNGNTTDVTSAADTPVDANPIATLQSWLVSGNEETNTFTPQTVVTNLAITSKATDDTIEGPTGTKHRLLVGPRTTGATTSAHVERFVTAPQREIKSAGIPGTTGAATTVGHYAWWVGDEGVKARANIVDAYASEGTADADRTRLQSAQRPALEAVTLPGASTDDDRGFGPFKTALANNPDLLKVFVPAQLSSVQNSSVLQSQLQKRWHDFSVTSRGVLADAKKGGLKHDLSYLLTRPNLNALHTALAALPAGFAPNTGATAYNRILSTAATGYATQPPVLLLPSGAFSGNSVASTMDIFKHSATWEQLWSYHNLGNNTAATSTLAAGSFVAADVVRPRLHTPTQHGIYPLLVQVKLFYKLRMAGTPPADGAVDRTNNIWLDIIPVAVLANPYNVDLEAQDYVLRSVSGDMGRVRLYYGLHPTDPENPQSSDFPFPTSSPKVYPTTSVGLPNGALGEVKFTIKAPRMEAGRAYVFTLENATTTIPATAAAQRNLTVNMVPDFNPANVLTFDTTKKIADAPATHAALVSDNGMVAFKLFSSNYTDTLGDETLIRHLVPHTYAADSASDTILVYPFSSELRHGGGLSVFIHDASNVAASQQSPLYQVNYRGLIVENAAYSSFGTNPNGTGQKDIAISWARTRVKNGASSLAGNDTPNEFIQSHLLWRDPTDPSQVRWGIFNTGDGFDGTVIPPALVGDAGLVNILYDVPRANHPPASIAQLRHFNATGHITRNDWTKPTWAERLATSNHSFLPNYPIGNSYPNPFIIRQKVVDGDGGMGFQYDGSYLLNDALQDRFYFSTFPATGAFDFTTGRLINNRNRPFRSTSSVAWNDPAGFRADSRSASKNLLVEGALNINSTSVDAWKAVLAGLKEVPVGDETAPANLTAPFARTLFQTGRVSNSRDGNTVNAWTGVINLTPAEIDSLAREIVLQIRRRGPFLSMA
ncbi:MAG: hypothetical protein ABW223_11700, partial [Rariglobus sp.]